MSVAWDEPSAVGPFTLELGGRRVRTDGEAKLRANTGFTDKRYYEIAVVGDLGASSSTSDQNSLIGLALVGYAASNAGSYLGGNASTLTLARGDGGSIVSNNQALKASIGQWSNGDIIRFAVDPAVGWYLAINGGEFTGPHSFYGVTGGAVYPAIHVYGGSLDRTVTGRFRAADCSYAPLSGYAYADTTSATQALTLSGQTLVLTASGSAATARAARRAQVPPLGLASTASSVTARAARRVGASLLGLTSSPSPATVTTARRLGAQQLSLSSQNGSALLRIARRLSAQVLGLAAQPGAASLGQVQHFAVVAAGLVLQAAGGAALLRTARRLSVLRYQAQVAALSVAFSRQLGVVTLLAPPARTATLTVPRRAATLAIPNRGVTLTVPPRSATYKVGS